MLRYSESLSRHAAQQKSKRTGRDWFVWPELLRSSRHEPRSTQHVLELTAATTAAQGGEGVNRSDDQLDNVIKSTIIASTTTTTTHCSTEHG